MKKENWLRSIVAASLGALTLGAVAGQDAISLARKPKPGDVAEFAITAEFDTMKINYTTLNKVTTVQADGSYSVEASSKDMVVDLGGQTINPPDSSDVLQYSPTGMVVSIVADTTPPPAAYKILHLQSFQSPMSPVKIGDEIKYTIPADPKLETPTVSADYKVDGLEKIKDWDTVRLVYTSTETDGDLKESMSGTVWVSTIDGMLVKSQGKWNNVQPPGVPTPLTGTYIMIRTK
jgi:hypothetical protein